MLIAGAVVQIWRGTLRIAGVQIWHEVQPRATARGNVLLAFEPLNQVAGNTGFALVPDLIRRPLRTAFKTPAELLHLERGRFRAIFPADVLQRRAARLFGRAAVSAQLGPVLQVRPGRRTLLVARVLLLVVVCLRGHAVLDDKRGKREFRRTLVVAGVLAVGPEVLVSGVPARGVALVCVKLVVGLRFRAPGEALF